MVCVDFWGAFHEASCRWFFTDKFALSQSDARISVAYNILSVKIIDIKVSWHGHLWSRKKWWAYMYLGSIRRGYKLPDVHDRLIGNHVIKVKAGQSNEMTKAVELTVESDWHKYWNQVFNHWFSWASISYHSSLSTFVCFHLISCLQNVTATSIIHYPRKAPLTNLIS